MKLFLNICKSFIKLIDFLFLERKFIMAQLIVFETVYCIGIFLYEQSWLVRKLNVLPRNVRTNVFDLYFNVKQFK